MELGWEWVFHTSLCAAAGSCKKSYGPSSHSVWLCFQKQRHKCQCSSSCLKNVWPFFFLRKMVTVWSQRNKWLFWKLCPWDLSTSQRGSPCAAFPFTREIYRSRCPSRPHTQGRHPLPCALFFLLAEVTVEVDLRSLPCVFLDPRDSPLTLHLAPHVKKWFVGLEDLLWAWGRKWPLEFQCNLRTFRNLRRTNLWLRLVLK